MDDNNYNVRIDDNFLRADFTDGQVLQHTDLNEFESVVKLAVNANYEDIQKIQDGTIQAGGAATLSGATLSTYEDETLQNSDTKIPTSMQTKQYVDASVGAIDLSGYATKNEVAAIVATYDSTGNGIVDNAEKVNNHTVDKDVPSNAVFTDTVYDDTEVRGLIQTNANNISSINTNLTNNYVTNTSLASTLTSYVKPADYATSSKGGTVKVSDTYGSYIVSGGALACKNLTFANYGSANNNLFVSKGTLENVITGKDLVNKTYVDTGLATKQGTLTAGSNITINGGTISATDTTYSNATTETAGLMSAADKAKLDEQVKEVVSSIEDPFIISSADSGIYKVKGTVYYLSTSNLGDTLETLETLEDFKTFVVSEYYKPVKPLRHSLSQLESMAIASDGIMERQVICVEDNNIILIQKVKQGLYWKYSNGIAVNTNLNAYLGQPILVWQNTALNSTSNTFAAQTVTIPAKYTSFLKDSVDGLYHLFIEIVYVSGVTGGNVQVVKTTNKIPLTDTQNGSTSKTSLNYPRTDLETFYVDTTNHKLFLSRRNCVIYMDTNADDNTIKDICLNFANCVKYDTAEAVPVFPTSANDMCIPLYVYLYWDNNCYTPNNFVA